MNERFRMWKKKYIDKSARIKDLKKVVGSNGVESLEAARVLLTEQKELREIRRNLLKSIW